MQEIENFGEFNFAGTVEEKKVILNHVKVCANFDASSWEKAS